MDYPKEPKEYTIKLVNPWLDKANGDSLMKDKYGNIQTSIVLEAYPSEQMDKAFKEIPEVGKVLYGYPEAYTTKAGKERTRFKAVPRPEYSQGGSESGQSSTSAPAASYKPTSGFYSKENQEGQAWGNALTNAVALITHNTVPAEKYHMELVKDVLMVARSLFAAHPNREVDTSEPAEEVESMPDYIPDDSFTEYVDSKFGDK